MEKTENTFIFADEKDRHACPFEMDFGFFSTT